MRIANPIYHEVIARVLGFLQRLVNGGGQVSREYGVGRGRIDLLVRWPYPVAERTGFTQVTSPSGRAVTILRA